MTADDVRAIADAVRARPPAPAPETIREWAAWLEEVVPTAPGGLAAADTAAAALAAALSLPTYRPTLDDVVRLRDWSFPAGYALPAEPAETEAAVERAVVWANLPPRDRPGPAAMRGARADWDPAFMVLSGFVRSRLAEAVRWIGYYVLHLRDDPDRNTYDLRNWARTQSTVYAAMIARTLARGTCACGGPENAERVGLRPKTAQDECERYHDLSNWDRRETRLGLFVFRAVVGGVLDLGDGQPEGDEPAARAWAQAFRHGILAKWDEYEDADKRPFCLRSNVILRCQVPGCSGDVRTNNRCSQPAAHPASVVEPNWWVWRDGTRKQQTCYRCVKSDRLKPADLTDPPALFARLLADGPSPGRRVWSLLSAAARDAVRRVAAGQTKRSVADVRLVVGDLNALVLTAPGLYAADAWPTDGWDGVFHPEDTELLALLRDGGEAAVRDKKRSGWQAAVRGLNRRLLQVAFPDLLTRIGCGRVFFGIDRATSACPICRGHRNWSQRPLHVWAPAKVSVLPLDDRLASPDSTDPEDEDL